MAAYLQDANIRVASGRQWPLLPYERHKLYMLAAEEPSDELQAFSSMLEAHEYLPVS